jgi:hypothetical protein
MMLARYSRSLQDARICLKSSDLKSLSSPKRSHSLAKERGRAGDGWMEGITDDYFKDRAPEVVDRARRVCEACESLLKHLFQT